MNTDWKIIYYTEGERQPVQKFIDAQFPKAKMKQIMSKGWDTLEPIQ